MNYMFPSTFFLERREARRKARIVAIKNFLIACGHVIMGSVVLFVLWVILWAVFIVFPGLFIA